MRNILRITTANLRKNKGQTFGMVIILLIAAMFLNIGLIMASGVGDFFDNRAEELNSPHFITIRSEFSSTTAQDEFIKEFPGVAEFEAQNVIFSTSGGMYIDDALNRISFMFESEADKKNMNPLTTVGDVLPLTDDSIYIPHNLALMYHLEIGDIFRMNFLGQDLEFMIAGTTEEILLAGGFVMRLYVTEARFNQLSEEFYNNRMVTLAARMYSIDDSLQLLTAYTRRFLGTDDSGLPSIYSIQRIHQTIQADRTLVTSVIAAFMTALSIILLVVGLIVVRFRITNSIDESMVNIATLKAIGFQNYQVIIATILQFIFIALIGTFGGTALAQLALPALIEISGSLLGLPWHPAFNFALFALSNVIIVVLVLIFAWVSSLRISKLYPIIALRGGVTTHSFKKNSMELEKSRSPLTVVLALKHLLQSKVQTVMIFLIIVGLSFASVTGVVLYYNLSINMDAVIQVAGGDALSVDMVVGLNNSEDAPGFVERMEASYEVTQIFGTESRHVLAEDVRIEIQAFEDMAYLPGNSLLSGRLPLHDNEIALAPFALSAMGKELGDWITLEYGGNGQRFLVTGVVQEIANNGMVGRMKIDNFIQLDPDFAATSFWMRLIDGVNERDFTKNLLATEGNILHGIVSIQDEMANLLGDTGDIFAAVSAMILLVVTSVISLVLYLVIKTTILRRRRELGIQKAIGFTTLQLMNQISISLMPTIFFGMILGAVSSYFTVNPLVSMMLSGMGIAQVSFIIPMFFIVAVCLGLIMLAYGVSMLIAWRIREISAYALVSE